jgi:antirestriction protein ArdC
MLWAEACARGFASPIWMTYKQAQELGGQVRKGERGSLVVFADRFTRTKTSDTGEDAERHIPFLRSYTVFNCERTDGLPAHYYARAEAVIDPVPRIAHAQAFFANLNADNVFKTTASRDWKNRPHATLVWSNKVGFKIGFN